MATYIKSSNFSELPEELQLEISNKMGVNRFNFSSLNERTALAVIDFIRTNYPSLELDFRVLLSDGEELSL